MFFQKHPPHKQILSSFTQSVCATGFCKRAVIQVRLGFAAAMQSELLLQKTNQLHQNGEVDNLTPMWCKRRCQVYFCTSFWLHLNAFMMILVRHIALHWLEAWRQNKIFFCAPWRVCGIESSSLNTAVGAAVIENESAPSEQRSRQRNTIVV